MQTESSFEAQLVEVWRLHSVGHDKDARLRLAYLWQDGFYAGPKATRIILRLLDRLGFITNDPEAWEALPQELVVHRAESGAVDRARGLSWTLDWRVAEKYATADGLPLVRGRVRKSEVLAYFSSDGDGWEENEIVVRRECVRPF